MSVTIRDVAKVAGVSPGTASRALHNHPQISESCIARVREAALALGYQPLRDRSGRRRSEPLAGRRVAIMMLGIDRTLASLPSVAEAIQAAEEALSAAGAHAVLVNVSDPAEPPRSLRRIRFDGIVAKAAMQGDIVGAIGPKLRGVLEATPLVWMLGRPAGIDGDLINADDRAVGRLAARALLEAGHRRLAVINPKGDHRLFMAREEAFVEAAVAEGASVERLRSTRAADAVFPLRPIMDVTAVQPLVDRFLDDPGERTAIFCPADTVAVMVYRALATRGVQPGADVAVVSCNNERGVVAGLWPALATIDVHLRRIGGLAVSQLTRRIRGEFDGTGVTIEVTPSLVPEASLAPPSGAPTPR